MMAFLWGIWGAACGAGAFACLRAACNRLLRGGRGAVSLMAANMALIGLCLALCALISPARLAWAGGGLAVALILGGLLQILGKLPASKEDNIHG